MTQDPLLRLCRLLNAVRECGVKLELDWRASRVEVWIDDARDPTGYPNATFESLDAFCVWLRDIVIGRQQSLQRSAEQHAAEAKRLADKLKSL